MRVNVQPRVVSRQLDNAVAPRYAQRHVLRARRLRDAIHGLWQGQLRRAVLPRHT